MSLDTSLDNHKETQGQPATPLSSDPFHFLDPSLGTLRVRSASHPSLASIHEVDEEQRSSPVKTQDVGMSTSHAVDAHNRFSGGYSDNFSDAPFPRIPIEGYGAQIQDLPRKRAERNTEDDDAFHYRVDSKRYKAGHIQVGNYYIPQY